MLEQNLKLNTYKESKPVWVVSLMPRTSQNHRGFLASSRPFSLHITDF